MSYRLKIEENTLEDNASFKDVSGNHECAVFVQMASGARNTPTWKKGIKVIDSLPGTIPSGTAIATFDANGNYPSTNRHAAFYISHDSTGIIVYDQWKDQGKVKKRKIRNKKLNHRTVDDASYYFVIE